MFGPMVSLAFIDQSHCGTGGRSSSFLDSSSSFLSSEISGSLLHFLSSVLLRLSSITASLDGNHQHHRSFFAVSPARPTCTPPLLHLSSCWPLEASDPSSIKVSDRCYRRQTGNPFELPSQRLHLFP
jgi:hypothetical protein